MASLTHGVAPGRRAVPREEKRACRSSAWRTSTRSSRPSASTTSTVAGSAPASSTSRAPPGRSRACGRRRDEYARVGLGHEWLGRRGTAGRDPLTDLCRRALAPRRGDRRSGAPRLGAGARLRESVACASSSARPSRPSARAGGGVGLLTPWGMVRAHHAVLATNAFRPLLRRLRLHVVPVYDYALDDGAAERGQLESIGWSRRQALADAGYMFHYYRLTEDQRILWGGWDALYYCGSRVAAELRGPARPARQAGRALLHRPSRSSRGWASRTAGPG